MTGKEFKKAITLLRDCENKIEFIVQLYDLVDREEEEKKPEKKPERQQETAPKKEAGQQNEHKRVWKPKKCETCGKTFQPRNNRQMRCDECGTMTVEQDIKNTAAELAATMR